MVLPEFTGTQKRTGEGLPPLLQGSEAFALKEAPPNCNDHFSALMNCTGLD